MYSCEEKRRCTLGIAKEKMFGKKANRFPTLERLVDQGVLLAIDVAYAQLQDPNADEKTIAHHAALLACLRQGHLCLEPKLIEDPTLQKLIENKMALPKYVHYERQIAGEVKRLLSYSQSEAQPLSSASLTKEQEQALQYAQTYPISLITGGPGTGKTYTAGQIVDAMQTETTLTAPTGKAAANLEEKIKGKATAGTLHSVLQVKSPLDYLKEVEPLEAKLIIVDECSMIDPPLFARLLEAIPEGARLVLMGDINQLPAVEGGSIFSDLIASDTIPTTTLTKCMRSDRREILNLAASILEGTAEDICTTDLGFAENDLEVIYHKLWQHVKDKDFSTFRILSTLRKGPLGVDALNRYLFEKFSKQQDTFPIMIKKNSPSMGLMNGDMGIWKGDEAHFASGVYATATLPPYEYAYCISVHKSQGSEYDRVLFLVPEGSEHFGKEVLYTAITRAKHSIEIEGDKLQIAKALTKASGKISTLRARLRA